MGVAVKVSDSILLHLLPLLQEANTCILAPSVTSEYHISLPLNCNKCAHIYLSPIFRVFDKVKSRSAHMKTHKSSLGSTASSSSNATTTSSNNVKSRKNHKSPLGTTPLSPLSSTSHSSLSSSTSCSLPSPFLPSQSLFWKKRNLLKNESKSCAPFETGPRNF
jgi:hypothetical protein